MSVYFIDRLHRVQMVDSRVKTDFIKNCDTRLFRLLVQLHHCGRAVASGDYILLVADGGVHDVDVKGVWDE